MFFHFFQGHDYSFCGNNTFLTSFSYIFTNISSVVQYSI